MMNDSTTSKNMYFKALEIYKNSNDSIGIARVIKKIGDFELMQGNIKKAVELHKSSISMNKRNVLDIEQKMKLLKGENVER